MAQHFCNLYVLPQPGFQPMAGLVNDQLGVLHDTGPGSGVYGPLAAREAASRGARGLRSTFLEGLPLAEREVYGGLSLIPSASMRRRRRGRQMASHSAALLLLP